MGKNFVVFLEQFLHHVEVLLFDRFQQFKSLSGLLGMGIDNFLNSIGGFSHSGDDDEQFLLLMALQNIRNAAYSLGIFDRSAPEFEYFDGFIHLKLIIFEKVLANIVVKKMK